MPLSAVEMECKRFLSCILRVESQGVPQTKTLTKIDEYITFKYAKLHTRFDVWRFRGEQNTIASRTQQLLQLQMTYMKLECGRENLPESIVGIFKKCKYLTLNMVIISKKSSD